MSGEARGSFAIEIEQRVEAILGIPDSPPSSQGLRPVYTEAGAVAVRLIPPESTIYDHPWAIMLARHNDVIVAQRYAPPGKGLPAVHYIWADNGQRIVYATDPVADRLPTGPQLGEHVIPPDHYPEGVPSSADPSLRFGIYLQGALLSRLEELATAPPEQDGLWVPEHRLVLLGMQQASGGPFFHPALDAALATTG